MKCFCQEREESLYHTNTTRSEKAKSEKLFDSATMARASVQIETLRSGKCKIEWIKVRRMENSQASLHLNTILTFSFMSWQLSELDDTFYSVLYLGELYLD